MYREKTIFLFSEQNNFLYIGPIYIYIGPIYKKLFCSENKYMVFSLYIYIEFFLNYPGDFT